MKGIYFYFLMFFSFIYLANSQTEILKTSNITGRITSSMTKSPLAGVTIRVLDSKLGSISKSDGTFIIKDVPVGTRTIQFSLIGYEIIIQNDIAVGTGKPVFLEIQMVEKVIDLGSVEVNAGYFQKRIETVTSSQNLNFEDIRRAPGVQEDVIRATALLPGVNVTAAGRNDLIVRGGAPFENLFIVDNIEVNNINHFGSQGSTGGPLSLINLDYVKNVDFSAGGFGAKYGDKTSSITNITLRNGNENQLGGKVNFSATGFGMNLEGPINENGSWIISARRSYLDLIFGLAGFAFIPQYWDFQGKANYRLDQKNTLTFLTISAIDNVKLKNENLDNKYKNSSIAVPDQYQNFTGLTWQHLFSSGFTTVTLASSYTKFTTFQNDSNLVEIFRNDSKEGELILKTDVDWMLDDKTELTFGNQIKYGGILDYNILIPGYVRIDNTGQQKPLQIDTIFHSLKNSTYVSLSTAFGMHRITLGGRLDYFNFTDGNLFFSPRLSYMFTLNEFSSLIMSAGRYYQSPSYIWSVGGSENSLKPILADQIVLGYVHTPLQDVKVQFEIYYKKYSDYPARVFRPQAVLAPGGFDDISSDIPFGLEPLLSSGEGYSRGAELFIQKKLSEIPLYGLLSISYSESMFTSIDGIERPSAYDSRFIFNLSAGYRLSNDWEVSSKFRMATGVPTTPFKAEGTKDFSKYNAGDRLPMFHALDLRIDKRWTLSSSTLVTYLDIQNIYGRKNVSGIRWNARKNAPENQESIGVLPSIGVSWEF